MALYAHNLSGAAATNAKAVERRYVQTLPYVYEVRDRDSAV